MGLYRANSKWPRSPLECTLCQQCFAGVGVGVLPGLFVLRQDLVSLERIPTPPWDYRRVPTGLVYAVPWIQPRALCVPGKYSTN